MQDLDDFSDSRHKAWCIYCREGIARLDPSRDHVPSKSLLSKECRNRGARYDRLAEGEGDYLPQVSVCRQCNTGFSDDENYLLCVLHAATSGSLSPSKADHPEAAKVLRSNRNVVRSLKKMPDGQMFLFNDLQPFTIYPDVEKITRVVVKNARGHAYHELGEPMLDEPDQIWFAPLVSMTEEQRVVFEHPGSGPDIFPEVGSRMMHRLLEGNDWQDGWLVVESGRYRFTVDWRGSIIVRTIIWEYLATQTRWQS